MGFSFQNSPKNLDPSYKMDLDFWIFLEEKPRLVTEEIRYKMSINVSH